MTFLRFCSDIFFVVVDLFCFHRPQASAVQSASEMRKSHTLVQTPHTLFLPSLTFIYTHLEFVFSSMAAHNFQSHRIGPESKHSAGSYICKRTTVQTHGGNTFHTKRDAAGMRK